MLGFSSYFSIPPALMEENVTPGQKGGVGLPSLTRCPLGSEEPSPRGPGRAVSTLEALFRGAHSSASGVTSP